MTSLRFTLCCSSLMLCLAAAPGCEIDIGLGDVDDSDSDASSGEGMTSTTASSASTSTDTAEATSAAEATSVAADESTGGDEGETAAELCGPPYEDRIINIEVSGEEDPFTPPYYVLVDADCVVESVVEDADMHAYELVCDEDGTPVHRTLEALGSPEPIDLSLTTGTPVHLAMAHDFPIDYGGFSYVVIHDMAGEIVLAHFGGGSVPAEAGVDLAAWFAPLTHALVFGQCEPVPWEDPGMGFIQDPCPAARTRLSVGFELGRDALQLFERTSGQLGALSVLVTTARHLDPVGECDLPIDGYSFVAYREG